MGKQQVSALGLWHVWCQQSVPEHRTGLGAATTVPCVRGKAPAVCGLCAVLTWAPRSQTSPTTETGDAFLLEVTCFFCLLVLFQNRLTFQPGKALGCSCIYCVGFRRMREEEVSMPRLSSASCHQYLMEVVSSLPPSLPG